MSVDVHVPVGAGTTLFPSQVQPGEGTGGVVYFYFYNYTLPSGMTLGSPAISIYCDGRIVAKLRKQEFVGLRVARGRHTFATKGLRTSLEETAIQLDVAEGTEVFVRLEVGVGNIKWWAHLRRTVD